MKIEPIKITPDTGDCDTGFILIENAINALIDAHNRTHNRTMEETCSCNYLYPSDERIQSLACKVHRTIREFNSPCPKGKYHSLHEDCNCDIKGNIMTNNNNRPSHSLTESGVMEEVVDGWNKQADKLTALMGVPQNSEWEKELIKLLFGTIEPRSKANNTFIVLKSFISKVRAEGVEEGKKYIHPMTGTEIQMMANYESFKEQAIKVLRTQTLTEVMEKIEGKYEFFVDGIKRNSFYNDALSDIKTVVEGMK